MFPRPFKGLAHAHREFPATHTANAVPAFICDHLFASRAAGTAVGLTWFEEDGDIQAFCDACWTADIEEFQRRTAGGPRIVCTECLDAIAALNDTWLDFGKEKTPPPTGGGA